MQMESGRPVSFLKFPVAVYTFHSRTFVRDVYAGFPENAGMPQTVIFRGGSRGRKRLRERAEPSGIGINDDDDDDDGDSSKDIIKSRRFE